MTLRMIYGCDQMLTNWASNQLKQDNFGPSPTAIGCGDGNQLLCVVVYHNHRVFDIFMSIAAVSPRWATKRVIGRFLAYPYEQLECERTTVVCAKSNRRSRKLVEGVGWVREGSIRRGWDGKENAIVYGMLRSEAQRWLNHAPRMDNYVELQKDGEPNERWRERRRVGAATG